jgi:hypothetical protein
MTNMSGDPEHKYFVDGMVEEIITALSHIRWLFVIARNSSFTYKGQAFDRRPRDCPAVADDEPCRDAGRQPSAEHGAPRAAAVGPALGGRRVKVRGGSR